MWVTNNLGYDVELSGVHLHRASQQEVTETQATALLANATYVLLKTNGQLVQTDSQPDANAQYYVRPLDGVITLNGFPSNPNGSPEVSPLEAFDIGKEEGESDLEDNKEATIDVSTYTEPVEITPTSGKDGMKKATVTLSNIPSGGSATAYGWEDNVQDKVWWFSFDIAPESKNAFDDSNYLTMGFSSNKLVTITVDSCANLFGQGASYTVTKISDTQFTVTYEGQAIVFTRSPTKDFTLWD